jgi:hypothetical protein
MNTKRALEEEDLLQTSCLQLNNTVDFKQAYDTIIREKLYTATQEIGIPNKLIRLERSTMTETKTQIQIQGQLTEEFEVKQGSKQGNGLAPILFNPGLEYLIRQLSVSTNSTLLYKLVQIVGYADDIPGQNL